MKKYLLINVLFIIVASIYTYFDATSFKGFSPTEYSGKASYAMAGETKYFFWVADVRIPYRIINLSEFTPFVSYPGILPSGMIEYRIGPLDNHNGPDDMISDDIGMKNPRYQSKVMYGSFFDQLAFNRFARQFRYNGNKYIPFQSWADILQPEKILHQLIVMGRMAYLAVVFLATLVLANLALWLSLKFLSRKREREYFISQVREALNSEAHAWYKQCFEANSSLFAKSDQEILVRMRTIKDLYDLYLAKLFSFKVLRENLADQGFWWLEADIRESLGEIQQRIIQAEELKEYQRQESIKKQQQHYQAKLKLANLTQKLNAFEALVFAKDQLGDTYRRAKKTLEDAQYDLDRGRTAERFINYADDKIKELEASVRT